jgi:hypothetical protein
MTVADSAGSQSAIQAAKMSNHSNISDYSRYFSLRQKVYLVNMSAERNCEIYESLSGIVTSSGMNTVDVMVTHGGQGTHGDEVGKATYKLTSEALGSGIQVLADLNAIVADNIFRFRMHGTMEMFQRRSVSRADVNVPFFHLRGNFPLTSFKKEWKRVMDQLRNNILLPGLAMRDTEFNLSAGGIGITVDQNNRPTPLSMFFIALDEGLPVCALAETVWDQREDEGFRCGFRFIHILKSDQERINAYVGSALKKSGGTHLDFKRNWVLVDKMVGG